MGIFAKCIIKCCAIYVHVCARIIMEQKVQVLFFLFTLPLVSMLDLKISSPWWFVFFEEKLWHSISKAVKFHSVLVNYETILNNINIFKNNYNLKTYDKCVLIVNNLWRMLQMWTLSNTWREHSRHKIWHLILYVHNTNVAIFFTLTTTYNVLWLSFCTNVDKHSFTRVKMMRSVGTKFSKFCALWMHSPLMSGKSCCGPVLILVTKFPTRTT